MPNKESIFKMEQGRMSEECEYETNVCMYIVYVYVYVYAGRKIRSSFVHFG